MNYMNAVTHAAVLHDDAVTGDNMNWFKVPLVVDVSGMEFAFSLGTTKAAASASIFTMTAVDGATGATVATTGALFSTITNSSGDSAWTALTPRTSNGTSSTDLDADDYVNMNSSSVGTAATGAFASVSYIYGKPASIA
jgi:hypothetical protein